jgi:hypothetical protein
MYRQGGVKRTENTHAQKIHEKLPANVLDDFNVIMIYTFQLFHQGCKIICIRWRTAISKLIFEIKFSQIIFMANPLASPKKLQCIEAHDNTLHVTLLEMLSS